MEIGSSAEHKGLLKVALRFGFDFHLICLLKDSFAAEKLEFCDWSNIFPEGFDWDEIHRGTACLPQERS